MKIFYQISLILFLFLALYIAREDVASVYNHSVAYVENHIKPSTASTNKLAKVEKTDTTPESPIDSKAKPKAVQTGGALKVPQSLLAKDSSDTTLSIKNVILYTNDNRKDNGNLKPLAESSKLDFSAEKKLQDMFVKQYFEHQSPSGVGVGDLASDVSYEYILIGENLALGNFKNDKALLDAWMASPGHRANILNPHYTEIGVAVGKGMYQGQEVWMAVQHFGLPQSACPQVDKVLNGIILLNQKQIEIMSTELKARHERIDSGAVYDGMTTNEQIDEYNDRVAEYNKLILDTKQKVSKYNEEVNAFNKCITFNTSS